MAALSAQGGSDPRIVSLRSTAAEIAPAGRPVFARHQSKFFRGQWPRTVKSRSKIKKGLLLRQLLGVGWLYKPFELLFELIGTLGGLLAGTIDVFGSLLASIE